jgi:hypothetical protein
MLFYSLGTLSFRVGTSAADNWFMISCAEKDHWWVHLDGCPSAHAIIETEVIPTAEELHYARQRILERTPKAPRESRCIYARVKDVERGSYVGEVTVKRGKERFF